MKCFDLFFGSRWSEVPRAAKMQNGLAPSACSLGAAKTCHEILPHLSLWQIINFPQGWGVNINNPWNHHFKILKSDCHELWWDVLFEFFGAELMDTKSSWHNPRHLLTGDFWQLRVTLALHANGWHHQLYLFEQRGTFARRHPEAIERWFL